MTRRLIQSQLARARKALRRGLPLRAEKEARRTLSIDPRHVEALSVLARALLAQERPLEAVLASRAALDQAPDSAKALGVFADALRAIGHAEEAEEIAQHGLGPGVETAALWLAVAEACASKYLNVALCDTLDRAVPLAPADAGVRRGAALLRLSVGAVVGGLSDAEALVALMPDDAEAMALLSQALLANGRVDEATAAATAAVEIAPDHPDGHAELGWALLQAHRSGELGPARERLREALRLSPWHHRALVGLDDLRLELRRREAKGHLAARAEVVPVEGCTHGNVTCVNPYEFIRKYECGACAGVMMCACDREFGERFLPYQLETGTRLDSKQEVKVSLGFVKGVCATCRGLPEPAAPSSYGTAVARYYWREIGMEYTRRIANERGVTDERREELKREVEREFEVLHARSPKYEIVEPIAEGEFLRETGVVPRKIAVEGAGFEAVSSAVRAELRSVDAEVVPAFHSIATLYAVLMGALVRDAEDIEARLGIFGDRPPPRGFPPPPTEGDSPRDHGSPGYYRRRSDAIERHLAGLDLDAPDLLARFDACLTFSRPYTAYLWAEDGYDDARGLVRLLPRAEVTRILRWMVQGFWERKKGWPAFLVRDGLGPRWVGVTGPDARLSPDHRRWIVARAEATSLPYELVEADPGLPRSRAGARRRP